MLNFLDRSTIEDMDMLVKSIARGEGCIGRLRVIKPEILKKLGEWQELLNNGGGEGREAETACDHEENQERPAT